MATVYSSTNDGYVYRTASSWTSSRNGATGTSYNSTLTSNAQAISASRFSARGGGYSYTIYRTFLHFDTSGISGTVTDATLKIRGRSINSGDVIALKATSGISTLTAADYDNIEGWDNANSDGSGGGDNESSVTKYSAEISTWSSTGYNDFALTSQAKTDMQNNDNLYVCLMNYDYDLKDIAPTGYSDTRNGMYYANYTGTSRDPKIDYEVASAVTDNAIFFGTNF